MRDILTRFLGAIVLLFLPQILIILVITFAPPKERGKIRISN
jgi:membrane glycosyltransferase